MRIMMASLVPFAYDGDIVMAIIIVIIIIIIAIIIIIEMANWTAELLYRNCFVVVAVVIIVVSVCVCVVPVCV